MEEITALPGLVDYNGLLMTGSDNSTLFCDDAGAIIDWVSQDEEFPRAFFTLDNTYVVVTLRETTPDLIVLNHYLREGERGVSVRVLLDFVSQQTDLRQLGRRYDAAHAAHYEAMWASIEGQLHALSQQQAVPPALFVRAPDGRAKSYFRYT